MISCVSYAFFYLHFSLLVFFSPGVVETVLRGISTTVDMGARVFLEKSIDRAKTKFWKLPDRQKRKTNILWNAQSMFVISRVFYIFFYRSIRAGLFCFFETHCPHSSRNTTICHVPPVYERRGETTLQGLRVVANERLFISREDISLKNVKIPMLTRTHRFFSFTTM